MYSVLLFYYFTVLLFYWFTVLYHNVLSISPPTHSLTYLLSRFHSDFGAVFSAFPAPATPVRLCVSPVFFFFFLICCLSPLPSLVIIHSSKTTNLLQPRLCRFSLSSSRFVFFGLLSSLISHLSLHQNKNKKEKKNHPTATFVVANPAFAQINNLWPPSNQLAKYQQIKIRAH